MRVTLHEAAHLLKTGHVVGVATETVYGLAASLEHPSAIQNIYQLKGRPSNNPLIIHVADLKSVFAFMQEHVCDLDLLSRDFWPGPMTLILPIKCKLVPSIVRANLPTAAFRIPKHPLALELLKLTGPLVMPSANLSGRPSSTLAQHVENDFGINFPILDGGACSNGLESTILIYHQRQWQIIRQGALDPQQFCNCLKYTPLVYIKDKEAPPLCPGQMYRHYAPQAKLHLKGNFAHIQAGLIVGFRDRAYPAGCQILHLGSLSDPHGVAAQLYSILRQLDSEGCKEAYIDMGFPQEGLWATIKERLIKAAGDKNL